MWRQVRGGLEGLAAAADVVAQAVMPGRAVSIAERRDCAARLLPLAVSDPSGDRTRARARFAAQTRP